MAGQETTGTTVTRVETTQEAIIARGAETHESAFQDVSGDLQELGSEIAGSLDNLTSGSKMSMSELKDLASQMRGLALDLEGAADELTAIIAEAERFEPAVLKCTLCQKFAKYMAPTKDAKGNVKWSPICEDHAKGWWEGADWVGKMFEIGKGIVEP